MDLLEVFHVVYRLLFEDQFQDRRPPSLLRYTNEFMLSIILAMPIELTYLICMNYIGLKYMKK